MNTKNKKIIPTHNGLERIRIFTIKEIFDWIDNNPKRIYMIVDEYKINLKRAKIFHKKGLICVNCGVCGEFFALESDKGGGIHLDLYGFIDTEEVLLTIDHIIAKSKGGPNEYINYQIMCKLCNEIKADND